MLRQRLILEGNFKAATVGLRRMMKIGMMLREENVANIQMGVALCTHGLENFEYRHCLLYAYYIELLKHTPPAP